MTSTTTNIKTRLGLQCQTPDLSKVYFTSVGTKTFGLKKKFWTQKNLSLKIFGPKKNILAPKEILIRKRKQSQLLDNLTCVGKNLGPKKF